MMQSLRVLAAAGLLLALMDAAHAAPSFQIDQVFSNADGTVQYVILRESAGQNGQNGFTGLTLTATQGARTSTFTFPTDLPSATTSRRLVLIATAGYVALAATQSEFAAAPPDYVLPNRFLPTVAGSVTFAGADTFSYDALPGDGISALFRTGEIKDNAVQDFNGATTRLPLLRVTLVEYYNAALDHYFVTDLAADIDALDSGRIAGWVRTGQVFLVFPANNGFLNNVCRFYIPPEHGNSHFFSAIATECASVLAHVQNDPNYSGYIEETTDAFFVSAPFPDGTCAYQWSPVYRLWNQRADSNHRYTTDPAIKAQMIARGYVAEGVGPNGVAMCAPTYP
jgi:hypothetical protein